MAQTQTISSEPLSDRVLKRLEQGATVTAIAARERADARLVSVIVDDLTRRGLVGSANSLCASGLGACGSGQSPEVALQCAGCPLASLR